MGCLGTMEPGPAEGGEGSAHHGARDSQGVLWRGRPGHRPGSSAIGPGAWGAPGTRSSSVPSTPHLPVSTSPVMGQPHPPPNDQGNTTNSSRPATLPNRPRRSCPHVRPPPPQPGGWCVLTNSNWEQARPVPSRWGRPQGAGLLPPGGVLTTVYRVLSPHDQRDPRLSTCYPPGHHLCLPLLPGPARTNPTSAPRHHCGSSRSSLRVLPWSARWACRVTARVHDNPPTPRPCGGLGAAFNPSSEA